MTTSAIVIDGVTKRYRRGPIALADVSCDLPTGAIVAIVGSNGAGKSTLMRSLLAFERPNAGSVRILGRDPQVDPLGALLTLGYVPQQSALYRRLSIADHLTLARAFRKDFDREAAERRLAGYGLDGGRLAGTLSGGELAQVSITLALACGAEVLVLDEPFASLDPLARADLVQDLTGEAAAGRTILISSHVVVDLAPAVGHLLLLDSGRVVIDGPVGLLLDGHVVSASIDPLSASVIAQVQTATGPALVARLPAASIPLRGSDVDRRPTLEELVVAYLTRSRKDRMAA